MGKPNIVYILADDLGFGDLSCYNPNSKIQTPNIDKLAAEGMRFTDAHSPSAVCTPTRYGILTGRYCWRSRLPLGVLQGYGRALIEPNRTTVARFLKDQGYRTGVVGKWHLGLDWVIKEGNGSMAPSIDTLNKVAMVADMDPSLLDFTRKPTHGPLNLGFDYSFILPASLDMEPYCYLENDRLTALPTDFTHGNDLHTGFTGAFWREGHIAPGFDFEQVLPTFTQKAIQFIQTKRKGTKPFFLYLPLAAPHTPWVPSAGFSGTSGAGPYGDFVQMVDAMVGKVTRTLDSLGVTENTLLIFTSDNGPFWTPTLASQYQHTAVGSLRGMKADAWEGGHRIPFIARWPEKIPRNSHSNATISLTSLLATCSDLFKRPLKDNEGEDSHSILPILLGKSDTVAGQEALVQQSSGGFFVVRKGDWKLILGRGSGGFSEPRKISPKEGEETGQLYNLAQDIGESNNVFADHPEIVAELTHLLEKYQKDGRSR